MNELQTIETEVVRQRGLFDYTALGVEDSVIVQQRASEIKALAQRVASRIVELGGKLVEVRDRLKNGKFKEWLDAEFPNWSQRTAYNFIAVWEQYSSADFAIDGIAPSALYLLAAPSTPKAAREMAKRLVQAGQEVSYSAAKEIVKQAKASRPKQTVLFEEPSTGTLLYAYVEQSDLDLMDRINACKQISAKDPVNFYDYDGEPVVITSSLSSPVEGVVSARGRRIVPEDEAKGVTKPETRPGEARSYIGTRVNVGTKSKPNWWVIVGPQYEFKCKPVEDDEDGFKPGFPPRFDPERAEQGFAQEGGPIAVDPSALCLCGCRAGAHVRQGGQYGECCECDCEIFQQATEEEIAERNAAEKALGITASKSPVPPPGAAPTAQTITRLKAEMGLEEEEAEKVFGEPSTEFFARPAGWFNSPIEISITLLPGGDAETRKIQYSVRDAAIQFRAAPLTAEDYGEDTLLRLLPDAAYKLVEQLAAEWGKNQWSDVAKKRLKAEAIARWRREPVEMVKLDDEEGHDAPADELEMLRNLLALVIENEIPIEAIRRWTDEQKRQAQEWASAAHLRASNHNIEVPARPEILQACICGELGYEHAGGICMLDACGCQQWRPGNYAQCSRCKGEIVTTANLKDFDGLCFNCRVADEEGKTAPVELPQEEINRIADLCNAGRIGEKGPLKPLAYVDGHPYLVTGAMGSGDAKNWSTVWAWPVYPPYSLTAKQTNQRTYEETRAEHYKRLEEDDDFHGPIDYNGVKINVGTKKKPNEWVMVGPKVTFVVDGEGTPVQKEETQTDGEEPALIELPRTEIHRMSEHTASGQIPNEQPVKICQIFNQPHVITGTVWKGKDCLMVFAMPILPLGNFGEEKAKTYSQAVAARHRGGISEALSYEGIKINCGSKKKPDWWVMVGPEKTFTVDSGADYPDDKIEADESPSGAPTQLPPGWIWAHKDKRVPAYRAKKQGQNLFTKGLRSEQDVIAAAHEIEAAGQQGLPGLIAKGLIFREVSPFSSESTQTDEGPTPEETPQSHQVNEFGVYVKGVEEIKIPFPKKAGKTEVVIRLVHDQADGMWRSSYWVRAGTGAASSPVMKSDSCYESRERALGAAGEKARAYLLRIAERRDSSDSVKRQINSALPALDKWIIVNGADPSAAYPEDKIEAPVDEGASDCREEAIKKLIDRVREKPGIAGHVLIGEGYARGALAEAESQGLIENIDGHRWYVWTSSDVTAAISSSGPLTRSELQGLGCQLHIITQAEMEGLIQQSGDKFLLKSHRKCNHPDGCENPERPGFGYCEEHRAASVERAIEIGKKGLAEAEMLKALHHALHHIEDAAERWKSLQENGATDNELMVAVAREFAVSGGSTRHGGWNVRGGKNPHFAWETEFGVKTLRGKRLLAKVREVMEIGAPGQVLNATAEEDDFTAPRCYECGRIDGAHSDTCSQRPIDILST